MYSQRPLSYAPTPYSYTPNPARSASINLDEVWIPLRIDRKINLQLFQEVKLASSSVERDLYESLAEIYSIIVTLDGLEKAYIKDVVTEAEYTETCTRLLKQYKSSLVSETVSREFVDLETFKRTWGVSVHCLPPADIADAIQYSWNARGLQSDCALVFLLRLNRLLTVRLLLVWQQLQDRLGHQVALFWRQLRTSLHSSMR